MSTRLAVLAIAGALGVTAAAQTGNEWTDWPWVRPLELPEAPATRLVTVPLPPVIYTRVPAGLGDVRVIDDLDREVPFFVHVPRGTHRLVWHDARIVEQSMLPGDFTQIVIDSRGTGDGHNAVELTVRETDFFTWVEVAASDDGASWRILDERLPLYRFAADGHADTQVLRHRRSVSPWLRLRLLHGETPVTVSGVRLADEVEEPPALVEVPATLATATDLAERHSGWRADFDGTPPVSEAIFEAGEAEFHRPVLVRASDDGRRWRLVGQGEIFRLRRDDAARERLRVTFPETAARHLRVEIFNRNDPLLPGLTVSFRGVPRHVVLRQEPGREYRLIYGRNGAGVPAYELARLVSADELRAAAIGVVGDEGHMPGYPRPLPWTERHGVVLWLALGLAIAVVGWLAVRSLRESAA
jgi:hypothetical protein